VIERQRRLRQDQLPSAIRSERSEQLNHRIARRCAEEGRADTLFVREQRRSRRLPSAIRSERSEQLNTAQLFIDVADDVAHRGQG
jgi:hypothetical protein